MKIWSWVYLKKKSVVQVQSGDIWLWRAPYVKNRSLIVQIFKRGSGGLNTWWVYVPTCSFVFLTSLTINTPLIHPLVHQWVPLPLGWHWITWESDTFLLSFEPQGAAHINTTCRWWFSLPEPGPEQKESPQLRFSHQLPQGERDAFMFCFQLYFNIFLKTLF